MANATKSVTRDRQEPDISLQAVTASSKIFAGTLVNFDANKNVKKGSDTAGEVFAGVAMHEVDNSDGAAGDQEIDLYQNGDFIFALSGGAALADIGTEVFVLDDQTVAKTAAVTNNVSVGYIVGYIDATYVRVRISVYGA